MLLKTQKDRPNTQGDALEDASGCGEKAQILHLAKKQATASFQRMAMQPDDAKLHDGWARDERHVLRARADLLHTLMTADADPKTCLQISGSKQNFRVCVMYNRMRCEDRVVLGPVQSTMSWVVHGAEQPYQQLMAMGDSAEAPIVASLLDSTHRSMPKSKEFLQTLARILAVKRLEPLQLAMPTENCHSRVMQAGNAPRYEVVWGALDINAQEPWQNPCTNSAIRLSVLEAAHQATREASRTKQPLWTNATYIEVKIQHEDECHSLTFTPFCDSEACTVTHVQFAQSVFDPSVPERGILNLGQNPEDIHAMPLGRMTPMRAYVCLKAHKTNRLNEAQLNYVHSRGLLQHAGFDTRLLPPPEKLYTGAKTAMPAAKSTRISGTGVDVLASSYHLADQVFTTITIVQYPPFGTQFSQDPASQDALHLSRRRHRIIGAPQVLNPDARSFEPEQKRDDKEKEDRDILYPIPRHEFKIEYDEDGIAIHKPWAWGYTLEEGEFFFIDGLAGDPYNFDDRMILFETEHGVDYPGVQTKLEEIRDDMIEQNWPDWNNTLSFYENMSRNETIQNFWIEKWLPYFRSSADVAKEEYHEVEPLTSFWYCKSPLVWAKIFQFMASKDDLERLKDKDNIDINPNSRFGKRVLFAMNQPKIWLEHYKNQKKLDPLVVYAALNGTRNGRTRNNKMLIENKTTKKVLSARNLPGKIPRPITFCTISNKHDQKQVETLQARICALESKLRKANNDRNTQALLERVLEQLDG